ncbi:MAG: hypothetical protein IT578_10025 [Verrucomicrobiae bacterium]|nr:hypothetical protein [Verrucomicrobiae bacterium]
MEIHRAEMALYLRQASSPARAVEAGWHALISNVWVRWSTAAGATALLISGRLPRMGRLLGWIAPFVAPRVRGFLARKVGGLAWRGLLGLARRWI